METDVCPPQILMMEEDDQLELDCKEESSKPISVVEEDIVALWRTVGTSHGLTTDIDICKYLLSLYIHRDEGGGKRNSRCSQCNTVLELVCLNCQLPKRLEQKESPLPVPQTLRKAPPVHHSKQQTPLTQENQPAQPFSTSEDAKLFFLEDSPELPQPVNDDDSDGGLDMEVFSPDAGDDSDVEMDPAAEKQSRNQDEEKPSKGKSSSKLSKKGKQSKVTLTAKRKTNQRLPQSKKAKAAIDTTSSTTVSQNKDQETGVVCTVCNSVFQSERGLASHMRRSSCRLSLLQPSADGSETKAATDQLQEENSSHPEIAASNSEGKSGESKGEENQVEEEEDANRTMSVPPDESSSSSPNTSPEGQAYHCHQCGKAYSHGHSLLHHVRHAHGQGSGVSYRCDEPGCSKTFSHVCYLNFHKNVVHLLVKPYQCELCKKTFACNQTLKHHKCRVQTAKCTYKCQVCSKEFKTMKLLRQHAHSHDEVPSFKCGICSAMFKYQTSLQRHMKLRCPSKYRKKQSDVSALLYKTSFQAEDVDSNRALLVPACETSPAMLTSEKQDCRCHKCGKAYSHMRSLAHHMRHVHGEGRGARYRCDEPGCSKTFAYASYLNSHKNVVHFLVKPYQCERCKKTYACEQTLKRHICPVQTPKQSYICHVCSKEFRTMMLLKQHAHSHDEVPTFMCHLCSARFKYLPNLKRHMKSRCPSKLNKKQCEFCRRTYIGDQNHTCKPQDLRPPRQTYVCVTCLKDFRTPSSLERHARCHDEVPRYECETCPAKFRFLSNLRKHMKSRCPGKPKSTITPEVRHEMVTSGKTTNKMIILGTSTDEIMLAGKPSDEFKILDQAH